MFQPRTPPPRLGSSGPSTLGRALMLVAGILLLLVGIMIWPVVSAFNGAMVEAIHDWKALVGIGVLLFIGMVLTSIVLMLFGYARKVSYRADQAAVVKLANGMPGHVGDLRNGQLIASLLAKSLDAHYAQLLAEKQRAFPELHNYHQVLHNEPPAALPEPIEQIDVIKPMAEWMAWIDEQPHTLLGGRTKAGKTWLATALLERRIDSGCDLFIIDPHSSDWLGLPTAGGSGIPERRTALKAVLGEYTRRMGIREEHKRRTNHELPHDYFDPLLVLIDEANAMLEELAAEWKTVLKQVASGSRKVGIALLMLAQSPLVEDLGISGAMRENFSRIALDDRTVQTLIDNERDRPRKLALQAAFKTMDRPAAAQIGAFVWLLDRRGLSPGNASSGARIWAGWDFTNGCEASSVSPQNAPTVPLPNQQYFGNESNETVTSPGAGVAPVTTVTMSAGEIAQIATLLMTLPPSEAAKKLDGYTPRKYGEFRTKVETVKNLIEGGKR